MHTLTLISDLQKMLRDDASSEDVEKWWTQVQLIEASLAHDTKQPAEEKELVRRLRETVTDAIGQFRVGQPSTDLSPVSRTALALQHSIERRTIGVDGWPMRS